MNKNKYYRVREMTDISGNKEFIVEGCESKIDVLFNNWIIYELKNKTLALAKHQIDSLVSWKLKKQKIVFRKTVK